MGRRLSASEAKAPPIAGFDRSAEALRHQKQPSSNALRLPKRRHPTRCAGLSVATQALLLKAPRHPKASLPKALHLSAALAKACARQSAAPAKGVATQRLRYGFLRIDPSDLVSAILPRRARCRGCRVSGRSRLIQPAGVETGRDLFRPWRPS